MSLLRKLTTRPVWMWEKKRPYPVRTRWNQLPPIAAHGTIPMVVLTTPSGFGDAIWTAWSWLRFLAAEVRLNLVMDGESTPHHRAELERLFPGAALTSSQEIRAAAAAWPDPVRTFVECHPLGRKFGLTLLYQQQDRLLYLDSDVLAFTEPLELRAAFRDPGAARYMEEPHQGTFDPLLVDAGAALGLTPRRGLNGGFLLFPQGCLDMEIVTRLLSERRDDASWFTEQTLLALLVPALAKPMPVERYVVSTQRQFYWEGDVDYGAIVARHFTGPTRHVMYLKGLPRLEHAARNFAG